MPDFSAIVQQGEGRVPLPEHFNVEFSDMVSDEMHPPAIPMAMENIRANCARGLPTLRWQKPQLLEDGTPRSLLICAGGPSIKQNMDLLRSQIERGGKVFAINDTYDWLIDQDIVPDYFGMCEIEPWPHDFVTKARKETLFCLPSPAHTSAFERLAEFNILLWHCWLGIGEDDELQKSSLDGKTELMISGGEAMSIRAISIGNVLGYRDVQMFGVDGSFEDVSHVYYHRADLDSGVLNVWHAGRIFKTHYCYARQMYDLLRFCKVQQHLFRLRCHGDGLVQWMHRNAFPEQYEDDRGTETIRSG